MFDLFSDYAGIELLLVIVAYIFALVLALTLHEFGHAFVATKQGDDTPKLQGRLTVNPLAHIDWLGFLLIIFVGFGWAKPVVVNPLRFKNYKKGMFLVAIAGVTVNLILAFISCPLYMGLQMLNSSNYLIFFLTEFFLYMFAFNIMLFIFNLIPIYPLDGFRVVETFAKYDNKYVQFMRRYGSFVLLGTILLLSFTNILSYAFTAILYPISAFWDLIFGMFV